MKNDEKEQGAQEEAKQEKAKEHQKAEDESTLSAGDIFWEKLMKTPYTNDRVGQAFVYHIL
jgi:hypothetical protein